MFENDALKFQFIIYDFFKVCIFNQCRRQSKRSDGALAENGGEGTTKNWTIVYENWSSDFAQLYKYTHFQKFCTLSKKKDLSRRQCFLVRFVCGP